MPGSGVCPPAAQPTTSRPARCNDVAMPPPPPSTPTRILGPSVGLCFARRAQMKERAGRTGPCQGQEKHSIVLLSLGEAQPCWSASGSLIGVDWLGAGVGVVTEATTSSLFAVLQLQAAEAEAPARPTTAAQTI